MVNKETVIWDSETIKKHHCFDCIFGIIYKATNRVNDKFYIGQTTRSLRERSSQHITDALSGKYNMYFHKAIRKYGKESFEWEIVKKCNSLEELNIGEVEMIKRYNSFKNGYNLTLGGEGSSGFNHSEETKKKISKAHIGKHASDETRKKLSVIRKGKKLSEETKKKMSETKKKFRHSKESKRKMSDARVQLGLSKGENNPMYGKRHSEKTKEKISKACKGENHCCYGKHLNRKTKKKISESQIGNKSQKARKYIVTTPIGRKIFVHGIVDFCRNYKKEKLYYTLLIKVAQGKQKQHKGYKCEYLVDN